MMSVGMSLISIFPTFATQTAASLKSSEGITTESFYSLSSHQIYSQDISIDDSITYSGGVYLYDNNGRVHYTTAPNAMYAGGVATDGQYYDLDGTQINSLEYIGKRYSPAFKKATDSQRIQFQNLTHLKLFTYWYIMHNATSQGVIYNYWHDDNGRVSMEKSEFSKYPTELSEYYKNCIATDATEIDHALPFKEQLRQAINLTNKHFKYDLSYTEIDLNQALEDGKGVCFHYAKYCHDVLNVAGFESEYLVGSSNAGKDPNSMHVWLSAKDPGSDKMYYMDPSNLVSSMLLLDHPESEIWSYIQAGVNDTYISLVGERR